MHLPSGLGMDAAATFPLGAITCGQGLFQKALKLNLPSSPAKGDEYVLVYGGSTATGSLAIQYVKAAGYKPLTTCSPKHNDWMKSHDITPFNYNDKDCGEQIRKFTDDKLKYAFDCISEPSSAKICDAALSSTGGRYGSLLQSAIERDNVVSTSTLMYTIFDEEFTFLGNTMPRSTEDFEFAKEFFVLTEKLIADGKLKTHPEDTREGGLEGVIKGMSEMKENGVSGVKLVYKIA